MRDDILQAALRVFRRDGPEHFTTTRVAAAAGISVGSLYQYFPNKRALVFALHARTVLRAWDETQTILDDARATPGEKVRAITEWFFLAEADELATMGAVLEEIESQFAEEPSMAELPSLVSARFARFVRETLGEVEDERVLFSTDLMLTTIENVGRSVAARGLNEEILRRWAHSTADMVVAYLGLDASRERSGS